jgi:hypothetical protein
MLRILVVDDNPHDRILAIRSLEREFADLQIKEILTAADLDQALETGNFDLVVTDYLLRWSDGLAVLRAIKARYPECPVIMFTNSGTQEIAVEAMKSGLDDYVLKSAKHYIRLAAAVRSAWERTQIQRKAAGLENRLQSLLNQLNVGIFRLTLDGSLLEGNPAFFCLLGLAELPLSAAGHSIKPYFQPEDYAQLLNQLKEDGQISDRDVQLCRADGRVIWVRLSETLTSIEGETIIEGLMEDVSDRKRAEEERYRREQQFKALVENAPDIIARFDKELRYLYVNPAVEAITGLSPEMLIGKTRAEFGTPEEIYTSWQEATRQVFVTGNECLYEFKLSALDGTRYFQTRMVPEFALDGTVESVLSIGRDVTEYKRVEQALRESESRFKRLVESNMIGCIFWDTSGNITDANDAFLQMVGYTRDDLQAGKLRWTEMTPVEQLDLSKQAIVQMKQCGTADPLEKEYIRSDGTRIPVVLGGVLLEGSEDKGVSFVLDLSKQKQLENRLRQQAEQLEQANRIKDEFLAILSHELRSPLNAILGWTQLLRHRKLDEGATVRALETIDRNAKLQTQLIEDLLDVSGIMRGKLSLNISLVNLASIIKDTIDTLRLAAQAKSIQIQSLIDPSVSVVSGDPNRLQQIIWNLLSNAVKFTPSEGRIDIVLERHGTQAQIQVSDTGKGISPEFLPFVFDYFRQADSSTTRAHGGLGLGLAIVRHLVELHGGTVSASSPGVGQGATFTVNLPLQLNPKLKDSEQNLPSIGTAQAFSDGLVLQGKQVLIVDDEVDTRDYYVAVLEECGASVTAVASAREALKAIAQQRPDILISDIGMPFEDGYALIRQVRALESEQGEHLPAVALTAYAREADRQQAIAAGFERHLAKPVEPNELVAVVTYLLKQIELVEK